MSEKKKPSNIIKYSAYGNLMKEMERGQKGLNRPIPIGMPRLQRYMNGWQKRLYILLGGYTGSGKTAFADDAFILNPYDWYIKQQKKEDTDFKPKIHILDHSMERSKEYKLAKWTCKKLFVEHGILLDALDIIGRSFEKIEIPKPVQKILYGYEEYFAEMEDVVTIYDGAKTPTQIENNIDRLMIKHGNIFEEEDGVIYRIKRGKREAVKNISYDNAVQNRNGSYRYFEEITESGQTKLIFQGERIFIEYDPNVYFLVMNDHIGKLRKEGGMSDKQAIDHHSGTMGDRRDLYGITVVDISQFNRAISDPRRLADEQGVQPRLEDFKESGDPSENADVVLALFDPNRYQLKSCMEYILRQFLTAEKHNRFRGMYLLKNSWGADQVKLGMWFLGEIGMMKEIKPPQEISALEYEDLIAKIPKLR
jgi:hypothetical protein